LEITKIPKFLFKNKDKNITENKKKKKKTKKWKLR